MTIRARLLLLLFPLLIAFLLLISGFFYFIGKEEDLLSLTLLGAKESIKEIDQQLHDIWAFISIGALLTLCFVILMIFFIAERISKPVRQLNQAALKIAAGNYETNIALKGPKEVAELAHTLNTMSECLMEHMSRLKASSLIREQMYGEYECSLLLQYYLLQKIIEEFEHPKLRIRLTSLPFAPFQKGLLFKVDASEEKLTLTLLESEEEGFGGLVKLNQLAALPIKGLPDASCFFITCQFLDHFKWLHHEQRGLAPPLIWSIKSQQFIKSQEGELLLENQEMIFLYNHAFTEHFETREKIEGWFAKVLRHFAEDGLDIIHTMLTNELNFLVKKQQIKKNFQIISMQRRV